jgi:hypothetical protein
MPFRFKDLMINVVGGEEPGTIGIRVCTGCTTGLSAQGCTASLCTASFCPTHSICLGCSYTCFYPTRCAGHSIFGCGGPSVITLQEAEGSGVTDLQQLRAQLQQALAEVDEQERRQAAAQRPKSRAEAEELEGKLKEALAELQRQKSELD